MERIEYFDHEEPQMKFMHICYRDAECDGFFQHVHNTYELNYLKKGELIYTAEGKNYRVESGSCIFTRPGTQHDLFLTRKDVYERYLITFDSDILTTDILQKLPQELAVVRLNGYPIFEQLLQRADVYASHLDPDTLGLILQRTVEELLINLYIISSRYSDLVDSHRYSADPIVTEAVDYISRNLSSDISLDSLCRELHITKGYLHQLFIRHLQITPKKYINMKRLMKARFAIRAGSKPTAVFSECGFQDYCSFYRNYLKFFGYPPSEESTQKTSLKTHR